MGGMAETSDREQERGIYAILLVIFLISGEFSVDGIWAAKP